MPQRLLKNNVRNKPYFMWRLFGILLILGLLSIRFNLWQSVTSNNSQVSQSSFNSAIDTSDSSLEHSFEIYTDTLYSGRALQMTSDSVSRSAWSDFVSAQNILQRYPGVYAIAYLRVINKSQTSSFNEQLNAERRPGEASVSIFPSSNDAQLAVLTYIAPNDADQSVIGYDLYTSQARANALYRARDSGLPQITEPLALKSDVPKAQPSSILMDMPVYDPSQPADTVAERQAALTGYSVLALHLTPLLDSVFKQPYDNKISVRILTHGQVIYSYGNNWGNDALKKTTLLDIGGETWQLNYTAPSTLDLGGTEKLMPLLMIISGIPLVLFYLFAFYFAIRYFALRQHHNEHHNHDDDTDNSLRF